MEANAVTFSRTARLLAAETRRQGLRAPGFRTPPGAPDAARTLRRYADGSAMVAVVTRGRDRVEVVDDMIEGIVVANGVRGPQAARLRVALWEALEGVANPGEHAPASPSGSPAVQAAA